MTAPRRTKKLTVAQRTLLLQIYRRGDIDGGDSRTMLDRLVEQGMLGKAIIRYQYRWFLTTHGLAYCMRQDVCQTQGQKEED